MKICTKVIIYEGVEGGGWLYNFQPPCIRGQQTNLFSFVYVLSSKELESVDYKPQ